MMSSPQNNLKQIPQPSFPASTRGVRATTHSPKLVIQRSKKFFTMVNFGELWNYRELLLFLSWRDIKVKYKQTLLGAAWAVIQPLFSVLTFTLFFGKLAKMPSDGMPYPVFSFAAMLPWTFFTSGINRGTQSLVGSGSLLSKVYFPRMVIPLSAVLGCLIDFLVSAAVFALVLVYYAIPFHWDWLYLLPLFTLLTVFLAFGTSLWLSALNVRYRDVSHIVPFMLQLWMFATPIIYPLSLIPEKYRWLTHFNPMSGIIDGFRAALFHNPVQWDSLAITFTCVIALLITGLFYFSRTERTFADLV